MLLKPETRNLKPLPTLYIMYGFCLHAGNWPRRAQRARRLAPRSSNASGRSRRRNIVGRIVQMLRKTLRHVARQESDIAAAWNLRQGAMTPSGQEFQHDF